MKKEFWAPYSIKKYEKNQDRRYSNPKACNGYKIKGQRYSSEKFTIGIHTKGMHTVGMH